MSNFKETARCTKAPELKYLPGGGTAICEFSIAVDRYNAKKLKEDGKKATDFIPQLAFGGTAEYLAKNLKKGEFVQVEGNLQIDYTEDKKCYPKVKINNAKVITWGNKTENNADNMEFQAIEDDDDIPTPF